MRLVLLTEIPAPYRIPLFNALADRLDLQVLFLRERNPERPYGLHRDEWRFGWRTLRGVDLTARGRWLVLNLGLLRSLRGADAVLLGGWNQPAFWLALAAAKLRRLPVLAWVESTDRDARSGRFEPLKRRLARSFDAVVVPGSASQRHVLSLGVRADRIVVAPNAVDAALFAPGAAARGGGRCRFLYVGRLSPEKGGDVLLAAVAGLDADLVVAGSGPEEARLRAAAGEGVRFLGHVDRDELPRLYREADALVAPSRSEPWGMALNEAAAAGLPLVASDAVGAAEELVEDGANGYRVPAGDVAALRCALERLAADPALRARMGERSRELAAALTPERWAEAVAGATLGVARRRN